jgi:hypothetical protein
VIVAGFVAREELSGSDLPGLYQSWDFESGVAQRKHLNQHRVLLIALVAGAAVGALQPFGEERLIAIVSAAALSVSVILSLISRRSGLAGAWYDGRALAESAKSMSWKYVMRAEPYDGSRNEAQQRFCEDLRLLLDDARRKFVPSGGSGGAQAQVTARMEEIRAWDVKKRLTFYDAARIQEQRDWYSTRSAQHRRRADRWSLVLIVASAAALALSLVSIASPSFLGGVGVATAAASSALAWLQLRQFAELAHAYDFTSHELGLVEPPSREIWTDGQLSKFVCDCEAAVSREHTMWRARREQVDSRT